MQTEYHRNHNIHGDFIVFMLFMYLLTLCELEKGLPSSVCIQQSHLQWWICRHLNPWAGEFYSSMEKLKVLGSTILLVLSILNNQYLLETCGTSHEWGLCCCSVTTFLPGLVTCTMLLSDDPQLLLASPDANTQISLFFCLWDNTEMNVHYPAGESIKCFSPLSCDEGF